MLILRLTSNTLLKYKFFFVIVTNKTLSFESRINEMYGLLDIPIQGDNKINLNLEGDIGISISAFESRVIIS